MYCLTRFHAEHGAPQPLTQVPTAGQLHNWFANPNRQRSYEKSALKGQPRAAACEDIWMGWFADSYKMRFMGKLVAEWDALQNAEAPSCSETHLEQARTPGSESRNDYDDDNASVHSGTQSESLSDDSATSMDAGPRLPQPPAHHAPQLLAVAPAVQVNEGGNANGNDLQTALEVVKNTVTQELIAFYSSNDARLKPWFDDWKDTAGANAESNSMGFQFSSAAPLLKEHLPTLWCVLMVGTSRARGGASNIKEATRTKPVMMALLILLLAGSERVMPTIRFVFSLCFFTMCQGNRMLFEFMCNATGLCFTYRHVRRLVVDSAKVLESSI